MILSGKTGAQTLEMAFVKTGVDPIEIIRQPRNGEDPSSSLGESRLYNQAQIRVLLADDPAELPGGAGDKQNIRLANVQTMAAPRITALACQLTAQEIARFSRKEPQLRFTTRPQTPTSTI